MPGWEPRPQQLAMARARGLPLRDASERLPAAGDRPSDLRIDAIFGTGLSRAPSGVHRQAIERLLAEPIPVLAVDVPSGLDCDTGAAARSTIRADLTVTFVAEKRGFGEASARPFLGRVAVASIGTPRAWLEPPTSP